MKWEQDLKKDIRFKNHLDDQEAPISELGFKWNGTSVEFTEENHKALQEAINFCKMKPKTFLEIGVCRNGSYSSTHTILKNLPKDGIYLGVDIEDKSYLNDASKGIFTLKTSSSNYDEVIAKLKSLKVDTLDFIFIDGWHSINQVLLEWEYTNILSDGGVVAFHDTTSHPGPYYFINNLKEDIWSVYPNICPNDHGFGYCFKK